MQDKITLRKRLPGFMGFWLILNAALSAWLASDAVEGRNAADALLGIAVLLGLTALVFALYLSHRVSYDEQGISIFEGGLRRLIGLQREQFIAFSDIQRLEVEFYRGGGNGGFHELLQFGHLRLWPKSEQDVRELSIHQMFVNRSELVELLQRIKAYEPSAIEDELIEAFVAGI